MVEMGFAIFEDGWGRLEVMGDRVQYQYEEWL